MPYSAHADANVRGTLECLRVASHRRAAFHYVSSLAVVSKADRQASSGQRVAEELLPLSSQLRASAQTAAAARGGYAQSKRVGELLVQAAAAAGRVADGSAIHRAGLIGPSTTSAAGNDVDVLLRTLAKGAKLRALLPLETVLAVLMDLDFTQRKKSLELDSVPQHSSRVKGSCKLRA